MKSWSEDKKAKLVQFYFDTKSVVLTQRKFRKHFKLHKAPSRSVILHIVNKFLAQGNVSNNFKGHSGRKRTKRTPENIARVRAALQRSPTKSLSVTVNAERYRAVLAKFWRALKNKLRSDPEALQSQWFQQDGATAHTARATRDWLRERFGARLISKSEACPWPPAPRT